MFNRLTLLLLTLVLAGCGRILPGSRLHSDPVSLELLERQYHARLAALADATEGGWPAGDDCDGTLWAGLAAAAGADVNLDLVEYSPGEIHRRPTPCWTEADGDVGSKSTVSNDMLLGYVIGRVAQDDTDALQRLYDYAVEHNLVMGQPVDRVGEVVLKYNQLMLLRKALGLPALPPKYVGVVADYEQHLQVLSLGLYADLWGGLDGDAAAHLEGLGISHPFDALFQAVCGDHARATALLLSEYDPPSYVRGHATYPDIHWLYAAHRVLAAAGRVR